MSKVLISPEYQAIVQSRYLLRMIEESNTVINSPKTFSVFALLKQFYLTDAEVRVHLKNQNILGRLHFYLIGKTQMTHQKIESRIRFEKALKDLILNKMAPLDPPPSIQQNLSIIYVQKKCILEALQSVNKTAQGCFFACTVFSVLWLSYNLINFSSDYSQYCNAKTGELEIEAYCNSNCPTENLGSYFYQLNSKFFALPALVFIGAFLQQLDNELLTRFIFSPLESIRQSAYSMTESISKIKDFLLDKASDPSFKRPQFLKA